MTELKAFFKILLHGWLFFATIAIVVATRNANAADVTIAAAASMQPVMEEYKAALANATGMQADIIYGSSGKLAAQIRAGAPFDIFVSADSEYPQALYQKGLADIPEIYAAGNIVLWTLRTDVDLKRGLVILTEPGIKSVAIANPKLAPYGRAAIKTLAAAGYDQTIAAKLVFGESIAQVNQYVLSGAADVAITAKSSVMTAATKDKGTWSEIDRNQNTLIPQAAMLLKHGREQNRANAQKALRFLYGSSGRALLEKYGYILSNMN